VGRPRSTLRLRVGGFTLAVRSPRPHPALAVSARLRPFLARGGSDMELALVEEPVPLPSRDGKVFDSGGIWRAYRHRGGLLYTFRPPPGPGPAARGVLVDAERRRGTLFLPPTPLSRRPGFALSYPLEELLFQHHAAIRGALVLHACGIARGGRGLVFCGVSGAGKTTTARLWARHRRSSRILSDDRLVLRRARGGWRVHGTPWHGSGRHASPESAPVAAIFFLQASRTTGTRRLPAPEAAARLLARSFPPPWDRAAMARALSACSRAVRAVPAYELRFRPDRTAIEAVEAAIGARPSSVRTG
jgi:hypothetical protein